MLYLSLFLINTIQCSVISTKESVWVKTPSEKTIKLVKKVAEKVKFTDTVEIASPLQPFMDSASIYKFIARYINPETKSLVLCINEEWFNKLPKHSQKFLVGFQLNCIKTPVPFLLKTITILNVTIQLWGILLMILGILLIIVIYNVAQNITFLKNKKLYRFLFSYILIVIVNSFMLTPYIIKYTAQLGIDHQYNVAQITSNQLNTTDENIETLLRYDHDINDAIKNNNALDLVPIQNIFAQTAQYLKGRKK